jgi:hypothetical protein
MIKYCPECGKKEENDATCFCTECGTPLPSLEPVPLKDTPSPNPSGGTDDPVKTSSPHLRYALFAIGILILCLIVFFVFGAQMSSLSSTNVEKKTQDPIIGSWGYTDTRGPIGFIFRDDQKVIVITGEGKSKFGIVCSWRKPDAITYIVSHPDTGEILETFTYNKNADTISAKSDPTIKLVRSKMNQNNFDPIIGKWVPKDATIPIQYEFLGDNLVIAIVMVNGKPESIVSPWSKSGDATYDINDPVKGGIFQMVVYDKNADIIYPKEYPDVKFSRQN